MHCGMHCGAMASAVLFIGTWTAVRWPMQCTAFLIASGERQETQCGTTASAMLFIGACTVVHLSSHRSLSFLP